MYNTPATHAYIQGTVIYDGYANTLTNHPLHRRRHRRRSAARHIIIRKCDHAHSKRARHWLTTTTNLNGELFAVGSAHRR